ncbi:F0F1 ATP synthase subunit delta [Engelhardtia mirabilis]|uniref:ATP synthase subunit delta n=1 Tax=Engelhardtia mirabilis TaxID=2528011 RepID=A0A518BK57_9BACT|nr:ATP synthase subunit delta [Planctomycetes bacterium Pla133]QDV01674.1 ATP synthase subunit delta [Planctomycetes bacterium Pla86]
MSSFDAVSARYAEALYALAQKAGALESVLGDVERLTAEIASPKVRAYLFNPRFAAEQRIKILDPLLGGMHQLTQNLVRLLFDRNRDGVLLSLGDALRAKQLTERGAVDGVVESARPLSGEQLDELKTGLRARMGKEVLLDNRIVPDLVGGIRVIVGSSMIDYSVKGRLAGLRDRMNRAPLSAAARA